jgi:NitT/TauT family transport system permease protein
VFFTIVLIGVLGYSFDWLMRLVQRKVLYWVPQGVETLRGL